MSAEGLLFFNGWSGIKSIKIGYNIRMHMKIFLCFAVQNHSDADRSYLGISPIRFTCNLECLHRIGKLSFRKNESIDGLINAVEGHLSFS